MSKGKLIVLEGLDGSGKGTQAKLLAKHLTVTDHLVREITFPDYDSDSSALVKMYLAGQFGDKPDDVNAYAASSFYAVDRYAGYKQDWGGYYEGGGLMVADRYTTSNAVHQASKLPEGEREEFFRWLADFEYGRLGLPQPDLVLWMDMPLELSVANLRRREADTHTQADIHEVDTGYLSTCRQAAAQAARAYGWRRVDCAPGGMARSVEDIHREVMELLDEFLA